MTIYRVTRPSLQFSEALTRLLPQLSSSATMPTNEYIEEMLGNRNTYIFVAEADERIVGMLTLAVVDIPTGRKAWIEDVVVDSEARGANIGQALVEKAKECAREVGARKIYLTSNPSRKAAHALYAKCDFKEYDTTLFRVQTENSKDK